MIKRVLCFENPARLSLKLAQMVVELQDVTRTLPIEDIGVVILDHKQITITHALIDAPNEILVVRPFSIPSYLSSTFVSV